MKSLLLLALICVFPTGSNGHARLLDPPGRSSAWRFGFNTPTNVNDNQLNCGGAGNQWASQGGKCGMCGDPYQASRPRENEDGGKYGLGVITKTYKQGQWINIGIDVTANHKGWHEIRICSLDNGPETEACFAENLLELENGETRWNQPGGVNKLFNYKVKLPDHLTCSRCSLQWKWHCGNNWGVDKETGKGCTGCGPQEEFWGCADVEITPADGQVVPVTKPTTTTPKPTTRPTTTTPRPTTRPTTTTPRPTTRPTTTTPRPTTRPTTTTPRPTTRPTTTTPRPTTRPTTTTPKPTTRPTTTTPKPITRPTTTTPRPTTKPTTTTPRPTPSPTERPATPAPTYAPTYPPTRAPSGKGECRSAGLYARLPNKENYDYYCRINCPAGYCPPSVCRCD